MILGPEETAVGIAGAVGPATELFAVFICTISGGRTGGGGAVRCGACVKSFNVCGRSSGTTTINAANISCTAADPTADQRCARDTTNPRDSSKLPSNIRHLRQHSTAAA
jgi:hypothetical protein